MAVHTIRSRATRFNPDEHLWPRVCRSGPDECWEWVGHRTPRGYGHTSALGVVFYAHRAAWESAVGEIPPGLCVCHHCDNPPCCNPAHLFLGTHADNAADKIRKGRHARARSRLEAVPKQRGERNPKAKLTWLNVSAIRAQRLAGMKLGEIADAFGVDQSTISKIVNNHIWFP